MSVREPRIDDITLSRLSKESMHYAENVFGNLMAEFAARIAKEDGKTKLTPEDRQKALIVCSLRGSIDSARSFWHLTEGGFHFEATAVARLILERLFHGACSMLSTKHSDSLSLKAKEEHIKKAKIMIKLYPACQPEYDAMIAEVEAGIVRLRSEYVGVQLPNLNSTEAQARAVDKAAGVKHIGNLYDIAYRYFSAYIHGSEGVMTKTFDKPDDMARFVTIAVPCFLAARAVETFADSVTSLDKAGVKQAYSIALRARAYLGLQPS